MSNAVIIKSIGIHVSTQFLIHIIIDWDIADIYRPCSPYTIFTTIQML